MKFPGQDISFTYEATPQTTGFFEVDVNSVLVHSKKGGQGHVDSPEKLQVIFKAIEDALAK